MPHTMSTMADSCRLQWEVTAARHNGTGCVDACHYTPVEVVNAPNGGSLARVLSPEVAAHCTIPTMAGSPGLVFIPGCRGPGLARTCEPLLRSCSGRLHDGGSHPARWPTMADPARRAPYNVHNGGQLPPPMGGHGSPAQWHRMYGRLPLYLRGGSQRLQWEVIGTGFGPEVAAHCTIPTMAGSPGLGFYPRLPGPGLGPDVRASPKVLLHTIPTMAGSCRLQWEVTAARHNGTGCVDTERYTSLRGSPRPQL